jgi:hypothetical protein
MYLEQFSRRKRGKYNVQKPMLHSNIKQQEQNTTRKNCPIKCLSTPQKQTEYINHFLICYINISFGNWVNKAQILLQWSNNVRWVKEMHMNI